MTATPSRWCGLCQQRCWWFYHDIWPCIEARQRRLETSDAVKADPDQNAVGWVYGLVGVLLGLGIIGACELLRR